MSLHFTKNKFLFLGIFVIILFASVLQYFKQSSQELSSHNRFFESRTEFAETTNGSGVTSRLVSSLEYQIEKHPDDVLAYGRLGMAYLQRARETADDKYYTKAESVFRASLDLHPQNFEAMMGMGSLCLSRHQFRNAIEWAEKAKTLNPHKSYIYGIMADAQIELGQYDKAIETLQKMVNLRPDLSSYSRISYIRELMGDVDGAIEAMKMAVKAGAPSAENTAWCLVYLGHLYFHKGDLTSAEKRYRQALFQYSNYGHAIGGLARIHTVQKNFKEAISLYKQTIKLIPIGEYIIALGEVYDAAGMKKEAEIQYKKAVEILRSEKQDGMDVDDELSALLSRWDNNLEEALELANSAYNHRPTVKIADILAWIYYKKGNYKQAHQFIKEALRLGTKNGSLYYHAGMIAYRLNKFKQARHYLEQALSTSPFFSVIDVKTAVQTRKKLLEASSI